MSLIAQLRDFWAVSEQAKVGEETRRRSKRGELADRTRAIFHKLGDQLTTDAIAAEFGMGRNATWATLCRLEALGVVYRAGMIEVAYQGAPGVGRRRSRTVRTWRLKGAE